MSDFFKLGERIGRKIANDEYSPMKEKEPVTKDEWTRLLENVVLAGVRTKLELGQDLTIEQRKFLVAWIDLMWDKP